MELNKFDPKIFNKKINSGHSPVILIKGIKGSGKTVLIKDIMSYIKVPKFLVMNGTEEGNEFYGNIVNPLFVYNTSYICSKGTNKFEPEVLNELVNNQKKKAIKLNAEGRTLKYEQSEHVCVILDDLAYDKSMMEQEAIKEILLNGSHYGITLIISWQYLMDLKPDVRANIDYIFVFKERQKDNIEKLYKYFFGIFNKLDDFKKTLRAYTNDYGCLVLDNTSKPYEDQLFWYKAPNTDIIPDPVPVPDSDPVPVTDLNKIEADKNTFYDFVTYISVIFIMPLIIIFIIHCFLSQKELIS